MISFVLLCVYNIDVSIKLIFCTYNNNSNSNWKYGTLNPENNIDVFSNMSYKK